MARQIKLRVQSVERTLERYSDKTAPSVTLRVEEYGDPREHAVLRLDQRGDTWWGLAIHFASDVRDFEPGDRLLLTIEKMADEPKVDGPGLPF